MLGVRETCPAEISDGSHSAGGVRWGGSEREERGRKGGVRRGGEREEGGRKEERRLTRWDLVLTGLWIVAVRVLSPSYLPPRPAATWRR